MVSEKKKRLKKKWRNRPQVEVLPNPPQPRAGQRSLAVGIFIGMLIFASAAFYNNHYSSQLRSDKKGSQGQLSLADLDQPKPFKITPIQDSGPFSALLHKSNAELEKMDIAEMNLLCAEGLPGSEDLDIPQCLRILDEMALRVKNETERNFHRFQARPSDFKGSESFYHALMLITVLQQDFNIHYNPARINDWSDDFYRNSKDIFIHGMLTDKRTGTCASMAVLYVAVGRRLGYPLKLVTTKSHIFARWDDGKTQFNIEGTNVGMTAYPDSEYMKWPFKLTKEEIQSGFYLKGLSPTEETATFLWNRSECLRVHGRLSEAEDILERAVVMSKKHPDILANLLGVQAQIRKFKSTNEQMRWNESFNIEFDNMVSSSRDSFDKEKNYLDPEKTKIFEECIRLLRQVDWTEASKKAAIDLKAELSKELFRIQEEGWKVQAQRLAEMRKPYDDSKNWPEGPLPPKTGREVAEELKAKQNAQLDRIKQVSARRIEIRNLTVLRDYIRGLSSTVLPSTEMKAAIPDPIE